MVSSADASPRARYTTPEGFEIHRLAGALGAEVRGVDLGALDAAGAAAVERVLLDHHVLFFPEQSPTVDQHIAFGRHYGELEGHPHLVNPTEGLPPEIFELSAGRGGVADEWHSDLTCLDRPALYSILHMVKAAAVGGDTLWANPAMAFDELSPPIRELCEGLTAIHDGEPHGLDDVKAVHPVVRVHPVTGRKVLFVNEHFTRRIVELSREESDLLLGYLTRWVSNPRFTVRYRWQTGTVAMWDNRTTQHFVLNDFHEERVIQRVTVMGDRVEEAAPSRWPAFQRVGGPSDTSRHEREVEALAGVRLDR
ncbi:MAG: TauD/TfdA dioxygenase family protein [Myxococcota bacterium]